MSPDLASPRARRLLALALLAVSLAHPAAARSREEFQREFNRTLTLRSGQKVELDHSNGSLVVRGQAGSELRIAATIRVSAATKAEAERYSAAVEIRVAEAADAVRVRTVYPEGRFKDVSFSVDYDVVMPEGAPLQASNAFG
ncbi:MAG TPA: hypothetical protein VIZ31_01960, partial [Vicinamibacteria bacterium]